jgi:hypothetical protein
MKEDILPGLIAVSIMTPISITFLPVTLSYSLIGIGAGTVYSSLEPDPPGNAPIFVGILWPISIPLWLTGYLDHKYTP